MPLHPDDWLSLAQGLAVGRVQRYPHKGDRTNRPNLVVKNLPDRWTAYCQSCKMGGVRLKEHVRYRPPAPPESNLLTKPHGSVPWGMLPPLKQAEIARFLASKNMDISMMTYTPAYSESRKRILFTTPQGMLGRDITESSPQKWLTYDGQTHYTLAQQGHVPVIITEDLFSAFKIEWATLRHGTDDTWWRFDIYAALGTQLKPELLLNLMQAPPPVVLLMFDGDRPGMRGATTEANRLHSLGINAVACCAPVGLDPKDMQGPSIRKHIQGVLNGTKAVEGTCKPPTLPNAEGVHTEGHDVPGNPGDAGMV